MNARERIEHNEQLMLAPYATFAKNSKGRERYEEPCEIRTCFMRDRDRIIHSKSFRRLKHKTQVFLSPKGDHYRTRLTHTLEVAQISRTIARGLSLNEDLTEAIALGHDLGHPPFGHAGEKALASVCPAGFKHNLQSLRVVELYENNAEGLNLTKEVLSGIRAHTWSEPESPEQEGVIVRFADRIAYINHDIDDAVRADILDEHSIPAEINAVLGFTHSARINSLVKAMIDYGVENQKVGMEEQYAQAMDYLRDFMNEAVYKNQTAKGEEHKGIDILKRLYEYLIAHPDELPPEYMLAAWRDGEEIAVCDYIAGMTDQFAIAKFQELFVPRSWNKL